MVRLAVFGGVYSNHRALDATLADVAAPAADHVWCLGDVGGFGAHPDRSIARLREAGIPTVQGNYDDAVGHARDDCACGYLDPRDQQVAQLSFDYTLAATSEPHRAWLRALPAGAELELAGRRVVLCHGSPRRVNEFLWDSTSSDPFLEWLCATAGADLLLCSHTGLPWHRALPSGRHVVNVGAIGRPANDGIPGAQYARITLGDDLTVTFPRVGYDGEAMADDLRREGLPAAFAETIVSGWWTTCLENLPAKERRRGRF